MVQRPGRDAAQRFALALAIVVLGAHFASFDIVETPLVTDVSYYVYFAWRVAQGAIPHLDFFAAKTELAALLGGALLKLGGAFGHPLMLLRAGFLGLAAIAGLLVYFIHARISPRSAVSGLLGVLAYCAFPLLGFLPSIGVIPKLLVAIGASAMGLCVYRGWWFAAGLAGALAFMDWQIGALAAVAAFAAALFSGVGHLRAALAVAAGSLTGLGAFATYFAANGALQAAFRQTLLATFAGGAARFGQAGPLDRWEHVTRLVQSAGPHSAPLFLLSGFGILVAVALWWRNRGTPTGHMLMALSLYHLLLVAFSAVDFQSYGDLFILLHSAAFFLALVFEAVRRAALAVLRGAGTQRSRALVQLAVVIAAVGLTRPAYLRPDIEIPIRGVEPGTTLEDQRDVARQIEETLAGRSILFLYHAEIPFLMRYTNPSLFSYWNSAAFRHARTSPDERLLPAARRFVTEADTDAYVVRPDLFRRPLRGYSPVPFASSSGRYRVIVFVRSAR